jgi:hypothetical protein
MLLSTRSSLIIKKPNPNFWPINTCLTLGNFKTAGKLVSKYLPIQTPIGFFSFSEKGCGSARGFFVLHIIEIIVPNGLRFFQLTIQPLRQEHPPQIVASWFIEMFNFRSVIVDKCFKQNSVNLLNIIKNSIYHGLNLLEFARELVPMKFDITMFTNSPCPNISENDNTYPRQFNPFLSDIQLPRICVKKRLLYIKDGAVEVSDERNEEEPNSKKKCN